jgi:GNAT superfamily N-acetyltransferase
MTIRPLTEEDIESGVGLSMQAGWNHAAADWRRVLELWPGQCLGGEINGRPVASGTLATYASDAGQVGWVGLILVDAEHRRRGLGTRMMETILEEADRRGVAIVGLDASDQGEPIYRKLGFVVDESINRWAGRGVIGQKRSLDDVVWASVLSIDRRACGVDRERLLRRIAGEAESRVAMVADGYALVRPGRLAWHLGPVIADDLHQTAALVNQLIGDGRQPATADVIVDVVGGSPMESLLAQRGFAIARRLKRMRRPAGGGKLLWGDRVYAASGFELG